MKDDKRPKTELRTLAGRVKITDPGRQTVLFSPVLFRESPTVVLTPEWLDEPNFTNSCALLPPTLKRVDPDKFEMSNAHTSRGNPGTYWVHWVAFGRVVV
jgi:hypothetical protein